MKTKTLVLMLIMSLVMPQTILAYNVMSKSNDAYGGFTSEEIFNTDASKGWLKRGIYTGNSSVSGEIEIASGAPRITSFCKMTAYPFATTTECPDDLGIYATPSTISLAGYPGAIKLSFRVDDFNLDRYVDVKINSDDNSIKESFLHISKLAGLTIWNNEIIAEGNLEAGRWYTIAVILNTQGCGSSELTSSDKYLRYSIYLDGKCVLENAQWTFLMPTVENPDVNQKRFSYINSVYVRQVYDANAAGAGVFLVDDIYLLKFLRSTAVHKEFYANFIPDMNVSVDNALMTDYYSFDEPSSTFFIPEKMPLSDMREHVEKALYSNAYVGDSGTDYDIKPTLMFYTEDGTLITDETQLTNESMTAFLTSNDKTVIKECKIKFAELPQMPPEAGNLSVIGRYCVGGSLTANYDYKDINLDLEDKENTIYTWLQSDTVNGVYSVINGKTNKTIQLGTEQEGKYIIVQVTPCALTGEKKGAAVESEKVDIPVVITPFDAGVEYIKNQMDFTSTDKDIMLWPNTPNGCVVNWESDNPNVLGSDGTVFRQKTNVTVTLTAHITHQREPGYEEKLQFSITVLKKESSSSGGSRGSNGSGTSKISIAKTPVITPVVETKYDYMGHWAEQYIKKMVENKVVKQGNFIPDENITRGDFVKYLVISFGLEIDNDMQIQFSDVLHECSCYPYIATAVKYGLVNGMGDGSFGKKLPITRQDMATIIFRAKDKTKVSIDPKNAFVTFEDEDEIEEYAKDAVKEMSAAGIINGFENRFNPLKYSTRAECAKILCMINSWEAAQ